LDQYVITETMEMDIEGEIGWHGWGNNQTEPHLHVIFSIFTRLPPIQVSRGSDCTTVSLSLRTDRTNFKNTEKMKSHTDFKYRQRPITYFDQS